MVVSDILRNVKGKRLRWSQMAKRVQYIVWEAKKEEDYQNLCGKDEVSRYRAEQDY